ncbi:MAG: hypothetical protein HY286_09590 [Planctomycetes bacterium]|nr:hypothetical protein [Planctomycetota bacterium]
MGPGVDGPPPGLGKEGVVGGETGVTGPPPTGGGVVGPPPEGGGVMGPGGTVEGGETGPCGGEGVVGPLGG